MLNFAKYHILSQVNYFNFASFRTKGGVTTVLWKLHERIILARWICYLWLLDKAKTFSKYQNLLDFFFFNFFAPLDWHRWMEELPGKPKKPLNIIWTALQAVHKWTFESRFLCLCLCISIHLLVFTVLGILSNFLIAFLIRPF